MYTRPEMTSPGTRVHNSKIYCYPGAGRFVYICIQCKEVEEEY